MYALYWHILQLFKVLLSVADFVIGKDILNSIWMAHGYNRVLDEGQSIEDNALTLVIIFYDFVAKMFFPRHGRRLFGQLISSKIHDIVDNVAWEVARKKICVANSTSKLDKKFGQKRFVAKTKIYMYSKWHYSPIGLDSVTFPKFA